MDEMDDGPERWTMGMLSLLYTYFSYLWSHTLELGREKARVEKPFSCWYSLNVFWNLKTWLLPCSRDVGTVLHRMRSPEQLTGSGHGLQRRVRTLASSRIVNGGLPVRLSANVAVAMQHSWQSSLSMACRGSSHISGGDGPIPGLSAPNMTQHNICRQETYYTAQ